MSKQAVKMSTEAAETLKELTDKAAEVAAAIKSLDAARAVTSNPYRQPGCP